MSPLHGGVAGLQQTTQHRYRKVCGIVIESQRFSCALPSVGGMDVSCWWGPSVDLAFFMGTVCILGFLAWTMKGSGPLRLRRRDDSFIFAMLWGPCNDHTWSRALIDSKNPMINKVILAFTIKWRERQVDPDLASKKSGWSLLNKKVRRTPQLRANNSKAKYG
uniref:Uncharacterized protein n=1 Tax=Fagus sylvatica TaxID=28930 RepID=A0A2N9HXX0_FAGSY